MAYSDVVDTLDKRLTVIRRIAHKYAKDYGPHIRRFQEDELVNEMWLSPRVRDAQYEYHLVRSALDAIFDYFRHEIKRYEHEEIYDDVPSKVMLNILKMDMEKLCQGLTRTQKLIVKLSCDGFNRSEIAKVIGLKGESGVRTHFDIISRKPFWQWVNE